MGNKQPGRIVQTSGLSRQDIERLQRRFQRLAAGGGTVPIQQFQNMVELGGNPFISRIFQLFDSDADGRVTLAEFTKALEYFGQLNDEEEQYKFAFRIYDLDNDGLISSEELFKTLQNLMGKTYPDAQLEQVVINTMAEYDRDGDGMLTFEEFKQLLSGSDLQQKFVLTM